MEKLSALKPKYPVLCPERLLFVLRNGAWLVETIRASGHVRRVNRPDTRPHLTNYKSQKRTCKKGAIHTGLSMSDIAEEEGYGGSYATRLLRLAFLSPKITTAILNGRQPADITPATLMRDTKYPIDWEQQIQAFKVI